MLFTDVGWGGGQKLYSFQSQHEPRDIILSREQLDVGNVLIGFSLGVDKKMNACLCIKYGAGVSSEM